MKTRPANEQDGGEKMQQRVTRPGEAGLANENRPGLGTRGDEQRDAEAPETQSDQKQDWGEPAADRSVPTPPVNRPPRREQTDAWADEQQRSTGMSGQSGGV